jgi:hypothetical protein
MMVKEARYVDDIANGPLPLYEPNKTWEIHNEKGRGAKQDIQQAQDPGEQDPEFREHKMDGS